MGWIYLAESQDFPLPWRHGCGHLPIVKTTNTAKLFCSIGKRMASSQSRQSGKTFRIFQFLTLSGQWTSSMEASRARTLALLDVAKAWRDSEADWFSKCSESSANSNQLSLFSKTSPPLGPVAQSDWGKNWPAEGMIVAGSLYRRRPSERPTSESDGSVLLPTPTASPCGSNQGGSSGRKGPKRLSLETMASQNLWPTPSARDWKSSASNLQDRNSRPLNEVVRWSTPRASDGAKGGKNMKFGKGTQSPLPAQAGGQLNPPWVEWLMGYPDGWTELRDWAIPWFRSRRAKRFKC